jgi:hypothetical protein
MPRGGYRGTRTTVGAVSASQLEQRIRLLPSVHSCSIDDRRVTVLVDHATDRRNIAAGVAYILADLGMERTVNVLGGTTPAVDVLPARAPRSVWLVLTGVVAVVCVVLGVVVLVDDNRGPSHVRERARPRPPQATTTLATSTSVTSPPTFPPDWQLRPGP